jgi:hypothetical protein
VLLVLLREAFFEELAKLVEVEVFDELALFVGELAHVLFGLLQPVPKLVLELFGFDLDALEERQKRFIEGVEMRLAVDHHRAGDVVKAIERAFMEPRLKRLGKRNDLLRPDWDTAATKLIHERD